MPKYRCYAYFLPSKNIKGIVNNWSECEKVVRGEPGARHKGFTAVEDAEAWLNTDAQYDPRSYLRKTLEKGIYFDAGTGSGRGVEISVTDEQGQNLLDDVLPKSHINRFGKHWIFKDFATNNYGELLACKYAIQIALKRGAKKIFGDSRLVIDSWSKGIIARQNNPVETYVLAKEVAKLRERFESIGGQIEHISGHHNPADLGFHK